MLNKDKFICNNCRCTIEYQDKQAYVGSIVINGVKRIFRGYEISKSMDEFRHAIDAHLEGTKLLPEYNVENFLEEKNKIGMKIEAVEDYIQQKKDLKSEKDYQTYGNVDAWIVVCEAWSIEHQWKKTTKVMNIGSDCIMSVSSQSGHNVAEALQLIPGRNYNKSTKTFIKANPYRERRG